MAYILHIDTSADKGMVALAKDGKVAEVITTTETRNHAAVLNTNIEELISRQGITLNHIAAFCVCGGPGSYTGLRIGLATAKGYCYAMDKPLMMHNKLELLAVNRYYDDRKPDNFVCVLKAREQEYFLAVFNRELNEIIAPKHMFEQDVVAAVNQLEGSITCIGAIDDFIKKCFEGQNAIFFDTTDIDIDAWSRYAQQDFESNAFVNLVAAEPFYLKQAFTHKPKKNKEL